MKYLTTPIILAALLVLVFAACSKNESKGPSLAKSPISLSQSTVDRGQQLTMTVQNLSSTAAVKWSISPAQGTKILPSGNQATAFFGKSGQYTVTADIYADSAAPTPYDSSSTPVTVSDSIYDPPPPPPSDTSYNVPVNLLMIQLISRGHIDTPGMIINIGTVDQYPCRPSLYCHFSMSGDSITISDVYVSNNTSTGCSLSQQAWSGIYGFYGFGNGLADGVYVFTVMLNSGTYTGTLTVTDQYYTFNWPYTTGAVVVTPQVSTTQ